jgi:hypothetical protein
MTPIFLALEKGKISVSDTGFGIGFVLAPFSFMALLIGHLAEPSLQQN